MDIIITPGTLSGHVTVPSSKSAAHRELIAAALAHGTSYIRGMSMSKDMEATMGILKAMGASFTACGKDEADRTIWKVDGGLTCGLRGVNADAGESGSTLRFLIPVGLALGDEVTYTGHGRLAERPLDPYFDLFDEKRIFYSRRKGLPLTVSGQLSPGTYRLSGRVSSQFFTGLLLALPLLSGPSDVIAEGGLESESYIHLTIEALRPFGIEVEEKERGVYHVPGGQSFHPADVHVMGDDSQAAFWLAAGVMGGDLMVQGLSDTSIQGDRVMQSFIRDMGGLLVKEKDGIHVSTSKTHGLTADVSDCPDLVPVLTSLCALSEGTSHIVGAARVRLKECDRLHAMTVELNKLGARIEEEEDALHIEGVPFLSGGRVSSWNDHRVAMALAVAAIKAEGPVYIEGADSVSKSYPLFWNDYAHLGGKIKSV
jgi:3-phosphoshikimate 1-carboxyvinyltransferase